MLNSDNLEDFQKNKIINLELYREARRNKASQIRDKKGVNLMRYLPISFETKLTEFPSNKILVQHGLPTMEATMQSVLHAEDIAFLADLQGLMKRDEDGNMVRKYSDFEISARLALRLLKNWTLVDMDTNEVAPINLENLYQLLQEDYTYISEEVGKVLKSLNPDEEKGELDDKQKSETETTPKVNLTPEEKN